MARISQLGRNMIAAIAPLYSRAMTFKRALPLILSLAAAPALAAEPPAADAPKATAGRTTADQIAAFLADSPVAQLPADGAATRPQAAAIDRRPHGVVEVAVGNHGYRSVYLESHMPIGESGELSIAIGDSRGGFGGHGRRFGPGPEPARLPVEPAGDGEPPAL
jgi:hypothetical protein